MTTLLIIAIVAALIFDVINGFHDAANSIATVVATRVLRPQMAVIWAAFFNFVAFLFFDTKVASTVGKGVIDPSLIDTPLILAALLGAIVWNLITWFYGIPSSSSHALIGALAGSAIAKRGLPGLQWAGLLKISGSIVGSPLLGMLLGLILMTGVIVVFFKRTPRWVDKVFRKLQLLSAALYSLGHGGNDAQKTMGIIAVLLWSNGMLGKNFHVPLWVVLACHAAMGAGTLMGGWRIVKTLGTRLTELKPVGGFCAETAGALTLFGATALGIPVSTTHTITGAIVGVGSVESLRSVRWNVATRIVWAWVFTIPASGVCAAALEWVFLKLAL